MRKALLVTGARQVGKTFAIREFIRSTYESSLEIN
ncbi:MAG: AAA family ATPase [Eggerthellaceae bacterium]|nr:AAA family ATPase [Eggerthellaceae bacterium]